MQDCLNLLSPKYQIVLQMSKIIKQDEQSGMLSMMMNNMPLTHIREVMLDGNKIKQALVQKYGSQ